MFIQFAELPVFDQNRAIAFYTRHLGCTVAADAPMGEEDWRWVELSLPGAQTNLNFNHRPDDTPGAEPVLVLVADDVVATVTALDAAGVEIVTRPHEPVWEPGRTVAEFRDSEGNRIVIASA